LILENVVAVEGANAKVKFFEPVELKWAGASLGLPAVHIPPSQARRFDAFRIPARPPYSVHFSTLTDSTEFWPELSVPGAYLLSYSVVSQNLGFARGALKIGVPESGADGLKVGLADADGR
jgi:hypothetical protein